MLYKVILETMTLRFLSITRYSLDGNWSAKSRRINPSVMWYVEEGQFSLTVNNEVYQIKSGMLLLLPPGSLISHYAISPQISIVSLNFTAEISFLNNRIWTELLSLPLIYPYPVESLYNVFKEMILIAYQASPVYQLLLQAELQRLLALYLEPFLMQDIRKEAVQQQSKEPVPQHSGIDVRVLAATEFIARHTERFPELRELCELVQLSESHFRRLFLENTGLTPLQYIHQLKAEIAKKQLIRTNQLVSAIGFKLGYEDPNYFTRIFKKVAAMTPNEFRAKYQSWLPE